MTTESPWGIDIQSSPVFELAVSLGAFADRSHHRIFDLGSNWVAGIHSQGAGDLERDARALKLDSLSDDPTLLLLIWQGRNGDVASFLAWLGGRSLGELYELLAPHWPITGPPLPADLAARRDGYVRLLTDWDNRYFRGVDPMLLSALASDASAKRALRDAMPARELVDRATHGLWLEPDSEVEPVLLVPQYHQRPTNLPIWLRDRVMILYPADTLVTRPDQPPPDLLRITRALADESRLRILRFLVGDPRTFKDVVRFAVLAPSTVHQHLVVLRASGLLRVHISRNRTDRYSLRPNAAEYLDAHLRAFLAGD